PTALIGGVGIGSGGGFGSGTGLPGGSEYGRRIQSILGRNYSPPSIDSANIEYVVIVLRIARDGRFLSLSGGLLSSSYVMRRSAHVQLHYTDQRTGTAA